MSRMGTICILLHINIAFFSWDIFPGTRGDAASRVSTDNGSASKCGDSLAGVTFPLRV